MFLKEIKLDFSRKYTYIIYNYFLIQKNQKYSLRLSRYEYYVKKIFFVEKSVYNDEHLIFKRLLIVKRELFLEFFAILTSIKLNN